MICSSIKPFLPKLGNQTVRGKAPYSGDHLRCFEGCSPRGSCKFPSRQKAKEEVQKVNKVNDFQGASGKEPRRCGRAGGARCSQRGLGDRAAAAPRGTQGGAVVRRVAPPRRAGSGFCHGCRSPGREKGDKFGQG